MTVRPPAFAELVNESDCIVRAIVRTVDAKWKDQGGRRNIFTRVELQILEVISGESPQLLVLELLGGRVGDKEMVVHGMPRFEVGEEDILFIRGNGRQFVPLTAATHGRYPVVREKSGRAFVTRSNHVPLHDTSEVALPMTGGAAAGLQRQSATDIPALSLDTFVEKIRTAKRADYHSKNREK